jgi:hypothetical protein
MEKCLKLDHVMLSIMLMLELLILSSVNQHDVISNYLKWNTCVCETEIHIFSRTLTNSENFKYFTFCGFLERLLHAVFNYNVITFLLWSQWKI